MARSGRRGSLVAVVTALALLAAPLPALATFAINIMGPGAYAGAGITVLDGGAGDLTGPVPDNVIVVMAGGSPATPAIPGFTFSLDTAFTNSPGGPLFSLVDLNWVLVASTIPPGPPAGGTITVTASATDFTFPPTGTGSILRSDIGGTLVPAGGGSSVTAQQWANLANDLFGLGPITPGVQGPFTAGAFSDTAFTGFVSLTPYSITDRLILTLVPGASTTGDLASTVVPEPLTMFLGGTGLLALAFAARRRLFRGES